MIILICYNIFIKNYQFLLIIFTNSLEKNRDAKVGKQKSFVKSRNLSLNSHFLGLLDVVYSIYKKYIYIFIYF